MEKVHLILLIEMLNMFSIEIPFIENFVSINKVLRNGEFIGIFKIHKEKHLGNQSI